MFEAKGIRLITPYNWAEMDVDKCGFTLRMGCLSTCFAS